MSISDLFDSGFRERNRGHFASIVRVALDDDDISKAEQKFLDTLAKRLDISEKEYEDILANPKKFPINPPYLYSQRLERLYDLGTMVYADEVLGDKQRLLLSKFAVALGFTPGNVNLIVEKALSLLVMHADLNTFVYEMQNMNK